MLRNRRRKGNAPEYSPDFPHSQVERVIILEQAGKSCTELQRTLLLLHYGPLELPLVDIAFDLGVSRSAVTQMHQAALRTMREALVRLGINTHKQI